MTDKPGFLNDRPVQVDITSLHAFARLIQEELDANVRPNAAILRQRLGSDNTGYVEELPFGADDRYPQGARIGRYHADCASQAARLLNDLERGLQAIAWAAQNIANDYADIDELNRMELDRVPGYFSVPSTGPTLGEGAPPPSTERYF
jgi:hypothetical protein